MRGVTVPGYRHLVEGIECQDAHRHRADNGVLTLAVSDGAGSCPRSAEGAAIAVGIATERFSRAFGRGSVPRSGDEWREALRREYEALLSSFRAATGRLGDDPNEFGATLTVAVLAPPWVGLVRIGDGFVVGRARDQWDEYDALHLLSFPERESEYVNETVFLTSDSATRDVSIECVYDSALTAVVVASDGLIAPGIEAAHGAMLPNDSFLGPIIENLAARRSNPSEVARRLLDDETTRQSADDKTVLMAART